MALLKLKCDWLSLPYDPTKSDAKVKTILHVHAPPLCHIQRQRLYKTAVKSTLIPHDNVMVRRRGHTDPQTENMDIVKHLEENDSSNHHVGRLRKKGHGEGKALHSGAFVTTSNFIFQSQS